MAEERLATRIAQQMSEVDNLPDTQDTGARLAVRFSRVEAFLEYLARCEAKERQEYALDNKVGPLSATFMSDIWDQYVRQRDWIRQRVTERATVDDADLPVTTESAKFDEIFGGETEKDKEPGVVTTASGVHAESADAVSRE